MMAKLTKITAVQSELLFIHVGLSVHWRLNTKNCEHQCSSDLRCNYRLKFYSDRYVRIGGGVWEKWRHVFTHKLFFFSFLFHDTGLSKGLYYVYPSVISLQESELKNKTSTTGKKKSYFITLNYYCNIHIAVPSWCCPNLPLHPGLVSWLPW